MTLDSLIDKQSVLASLKAPNKKQLLQELSHALATQVAIDHRVIFETLLKREKLGSTGIGQGIAIPHGKLPSISRVYGLFARLAQPVDFDSVDGQPVDLVCLACGRAVDPLDDTGHRPDPGNLYVTTCPECAA